MSLATDGLHQELTGARDSQLARRLEISIMFLTLKFKDQTLDDSSAVLKGKSISRLVQP